MTPQLLFLEQVTQNTPTFGSSSEPPNSTKPFSISSQGESVQPAQPRGDGTHAPGAAAPQAGHQEEFPHCKSGQALEPPPLEVPKK